ncbi:hypothetical protein CPLU01_15429 [Colletotrichum plurivorum]|uniref:Uncharacterized protein n=1 Tax=Colletotrichum plurivorum TaxID=2175906 RepID=A0A8H6JB39_9PEZI|nr:hypothetical protein CPLU01_15429 [Colletotrichum plurivorum]
MWAMSLSLLVHLPKRKDTKASECCSDTGHRWAGILGKAVLTHQNAWAVGGILWAELGNGQVWATGKPVPGWEVLRAKITRDLKVTKPIAQMCGGGSGRDVETIADSRCWWKPGCVATVTMTDFIMIAAVRKMDSYVCRRDI